MKTIRLLLSALLILQNILLPFSYVGNQIIPTRYVSAAEEIPIIEIEYDTKDNYTPEAKEYVTKVNSQANNGKLYNFYTLSGVVKTVKVLETGKDGNDPESKGYYKTGIGAPGYLIVAYDAINGNSLSYQDWIAATTTNENGKFAIPIEKTNSGVFLVVLKPEGDTFRFITSYDIGAAKINRATTYPENGINIGVIELVDEIKTIEELEEDIPNSVKVWDEKKYWACGEESKITYTKGDIRAQASVTAKESRSGNVSLNSIKNLIAGNLPTLNIPTSPSVPVTNNIYTGRSAFILGNDISLGASMKSFFFNGINNLITNENDVLPPCSDFLKSNQINTSDRNNNYYISSGMSGLSLPGTVENMMETYEIQQETLDRTDACREPSGEIKKYSWLREKGYVGPILQNIRGDENHYNMATRISQNKAENDSIANLENENSEKEISRTKAFPTKEEREITGTADPSGDTPAMVEYKTFIPLNNENVNTFTTTYTDKAQGTLFNIPGMEPEETSTLIYEIGVPKGLCSMSEVEKDGKNLNLNDALKAGFDEYNPVSESFVVTNSLIENYQNGEKVKVEDLGNINFYDDYLKGNVVMSFLKNLVVTLNGYLNPTEGLKTMTSCAYPTNTDDPNSYKVLNGDDSDLEGDTPLEECNSSKEKYGEMTCEIVNIGGGDIEYRQYKNYSYECSGETEYKIDFISEEDTSNTTELKGSPAKTAKLISQSFQTPGEMPLDIRGANITIFQLAGQAKVEGSKMSLEKSPEMHAKSDFDKTRFSVAIPDGTEGKVLAYNTSLIKLIDRSSRSSTQETEYIYAGGGSSGGAMPDALENPIPCPVGNDTCGAMITCESYPNCHGSNSYWSFMGESCTFSIPGIIGTMGPLDSSSVCSNKTPKAGDYGYALDVISTCGERWVYAPKYEDITEWKVVKSGSLSNSQYANFMDLEGIAGGKVIKLRFLHLGQIFANTGATVLPGASVAEYATWVIGGTDNSHLHIEMLIDGKAVPPEGNLQCGA